MANSDVIAGIYEIHQQIGAGGGGTVYLGRHLRLQKLVVLKADKRSLSAKEETLRREVDMLKNLSQSYIPQVYDFVQENGVVYTVMDYIEGESLDKLLARGQKIEQAEVIRWACQLLEALSYLHQVPPHGILHGDIKPANIMLRPNGDICLIDFNIALALGEDGAVKVGFSRGYASPEHYGISYGSKHHYSEQTEVDDPEKTEVSFSAGSVTRSQPGVLLDVRSDIYSLGATLYHLLSGRKPQQRAEDVKPLTEQECSPAVAAIIQKAMAPEPEKRYQTAEEMRMAFLELPVKDIRMVRHKRRKLCTGISVTLLFLAGVGCCFEGMQLKNQRQQALTMAEYSADLLEKGDVSGAVREALLAIPEEQNIFTAPVTAQAQKALTDALGVYQLADGYKSYRTLELPAIPFDMELSPSGNRLAVVYGYETAVYDLESGECLVKLPIQKSALSDCLFIDEDRIVYAAEDGIKAYCISEATEIWRGEAATFLTLSGDGKRVAAVNGKEQEAVVYAVETGEKITECSFGGKQLSVASNDIMADPKDNIFSLNGDGSFLAVSFSDGGVTLFDLQNPENSLILYDTSDYRHFEGGFYKDYFAYGARTGGKNILGLADMEEGVLLGENVSQNPYYLSVSEQGIYAANGNVLVKLEPDGSQLELAYTENANITAFAVGEKYALTACDNKTYAFYDSGAHLSSVETSSEICDFLKIGREYAVVGNRTEPVLRVLKLENYEDAILFSYDARYSHEEARINRDGSRAMLFSPTDFRIYDREGNSVIEVALPEAAQIYDEQYRKTAEGDYLEVIWYDGTVRKYDATDGQLLSEEKGQAPDRDLQEEFLTEKHRVVSGLHEAPVVYDLKTGEKKAVLEADGYLTYVTELQSCLITEYISGAGERYGLLLNEQFEVLAYLPGLCDVWNGNLIFDYTSGNLRQCRLYSLQELIALGERNTGE